MFSWSPYENPPGTHNQSFILPGLFLNTCPGYQDYLFIYIRSFSWVSYKVHSFLRTAHSNILSPLWSMELLFWNRVHLRFIINNIFSGLGTCCLEGHFQSRKKPNLQESQRVWRFPYLNNAVKNYWIRLEDCAGVAVRKLPKVGSSNVGLFALILPTPTFSEIW